MSVQERTKTVYVTENGTEWDTFDKALEDDFSAKIVNIMRRGGVLFDFDNNMSPGTVGDWIWRHREEVADLIATSPKVTPREWENRVKG